jgi:hypothetical protein
VPARLIGRRGEQPPSFIEQAATLDAGR